MRFILGPLVGYSIRVKQRLLIARRVVESINELQRAGAVINFNTFCTAARVSKTFLYDPKHSDLAQQIRALRQVALPSTATKPTRSSKSDSAKDAQIARFKERVNALEEQVRSLQEENELLYGKLTNCKGPTPKPRSHYTFMPSLRSFSSCLGLSVPSIVR